MKLTAHQPVYMPWLGLFSKIASADKFCIFDNVAFERHGYSNRVQIKTAHGVQWLTVPVEHQGTQVVLHEVRIARAQPWRRKHLRAIECAYAKAPYFGKYFPDLTAMLSEDWVFLSSLNECLLRYFLDALGIRTPVVRASDYEFCGEKSALVLDMAKQLGASTYIFGAKGRDYADVPAFGREGILIEFQEYRHPTYPQLSGDGHGFVKGLSVMDLLMNCGPDSLKILMGESA